MSAKRAKQSRKNNPTITANKVDNRRKQIICPSNNISNYIEDLVDVAIEDHIGLLNKTMNFEDFVKHNRISNPSAIKDLHRIFDIPGYLDRQKDLREYLTKIISAQMRYKV